ncbi:hypothetical protein L7F22_065109 [Adiantum nelumboides]|nr:hypothetical protein [Adiantum nelumboides]MCO5610867.1 hypothetical protein [Adiantum nelumboides]
MPRMSDQDAADDDVILVPHSANQKKRVELRVIQLLPPRVVHVPHPSAFLHVVQQLTGLHAPDDIPEEYYVCAATAAYSSCLESSPLSPQQLVASCCASESTTSSTVASPGSAVAEVSAAVERQPADSGSNQRQSRRRQCGNLKRGGGAGAARKKPRLTTQLASPADYSTSSAATVEALSENKDSSCSATSSARPFSSALLIHSISPDASPEYNSSSYCTEPPPATISSNYNHDINSESTTLEIEVPLQLLASESAASPHSAPTKLWDVDINEPDFQLQLDDRFQDLLHSLFELPLLF